jgi:WD40 repeat protein
MVQYPLAFTASDPGSTILTAGEDGFVRHWDPRTAAAIWEASPASLPGALGSGKWLSTIAVDSDSNWLVVAGGPAPTVWHLRSHMLAATLPVTGPTQAATFTRDGVRTYVYIFMRCANRIYIYIYIYIYIIYIYY